MTIRLWLALLAALGLTLGAAAHAEVRDLRFGVVAHNVLDQYDREESYNYEAEIVFDSPAILELFGHPRPYLMVSLNDSDYTSFAGGGLYWRWEFADGWAFEPGFGYVGHNGEIDIPFPQGDPRNAGVGDDRVLLGSRDLFRTTFALEREVGDHFAVQGFFEHLSHGQLIGRGRNQGLDEAGIRFVYRLRPD